MEPRFFDGITSTPHKLKFEIWGEVIKGSYSEKTFHWLIADLEIIKAACNSTDAILTVKTDPNIRICLDKDNYERILPLIKTPQKHVSIYQYFWLFLGISVVVLSLLFSFSSLISFSAKHFPENIENKIGQEIANDAIKKFKILNTNKGEKALHKLLSKLEKHTDLKKITVKVVQCEEVNAFASPGNNIVIYSALIQKAETPEELAGILAHEMGHLYHKHPMQALIRYFGFSFLTKLVAPGAENFANVGQLIVFSQYSQSFEEEADNFALNLLKKAKISNAGFKVFFERLQKEQLSDHNIVLQYLSTHPKTHDRLEAINQTIPYDSEGLLKDGEWIALKNMCANDPSTQVEAK